MTFASVSEVEARFSKLRGSLDDGGYLESFGSDSLRLVEHLYNDLVGTTDSLQKTLVEYAHYKKIAEELEDGVLPFKEENVRLSKENSQLRLGIARAFEDAEDKARDPLSRLRELEDENNDLKLLVSQFAERVKKAEVDSLEKTNRIIKLQEKDLAPTILTTDSAGRKAMTQRQTMEVDYFVPEACPQCIRLRNYVEYGKHSDRNPKTVDYIKLSDSRIEALQLQLRSLKNMEKEHMSLISSLKNRVGTRDSEIEKLRDLIKVRAGAGGDNIRNGKGGKNCEIELKSAEMKLQILQMRNMELEKKMKKSIFEEHESYMLGKIPSQFGEKNLANIFLDKELDKYPSHDKMTLLEKLYYLEQQLSHCCKEKAILQRKLQEFRLKQQSSTAVYSEKDVKLQAPSTFHSDRENIGAISNRKTMKDGSQSETHVSNEHQFAEKSRQSQVVPVHKSRKKQPAENQGGLQTTLSNKLEFRKNAAFRSESSTTRLAATLSENSKGPKRRLGVVPGKESEVDVGSSGAEESDFEETGSDLVDNGLIVNNGNNVAVIHQQQAGKTGKGSTNVKFTRTSKAKAPAKQINKSDFRKNVAFRSGSSTTGLAATLSENSKGPKRRLGVVPEKESEVDVGSSGAEESDFEETGSDLVDNGLSVNNGNQGAVIHQQQASKDGKGSTNVKFTRTSKAKAPGKQIVDTAKDEVDQKGSTAKANIKKISKHLSSGTSVSSGAKEKLKTQKYARISEERHKATDLVTDECVEMDDYSSVDYTSSDEDTNGNRSLETCGNDDKYQDTTTPKSALKSNRVTLKQQSSTVVRPEKDAKLQAPSTFHPGTENIGAIPNRKIMKDGSQYETHVSKEQQFAEKSRQSQVVPVHKSRKKPAENQDGVQTTLSNKSEFRKNAAFRSESSTTRHAATLSENSKRPKIGLEVVPEKESEVDVGSSGAEESDFEETGSDLVDNGLIVNNGNQGAVIHQQQASKDGRGSTNIKFTRTSKAKTPGKQIVDTAKDEVDQKGSTAKANIKKISKHLSSGTSASSGAKDKLKTQKYARISEERHKATDLGTGEFVEIDDYGSVDYTSSDEDTNGNRSLETCGNDDKYQDTTTPKSALKSNRVTLKQQSSTVVRPEKDAILQAPSTFHPGTEPGTEGRELADLEYGRGRSSDGGDGAAIYGAASDSVQYKKAMRDIHLEHGRGRSSDGGDGAAGYGVAGDSSQYRRAMRDIPLYPMHRKSNSQLSHEVPSFEDGRNSGFNTQSGNAEKGYSLRSIGVNTEGSHHCSLPWEGKIDDSQEKKLLLDKVATLQRKLDELQRESSRHQLKTFELQGELERSKHVLQMEKQERELATSELRRAQDRNSETSARLLMTSSLGSDPLRKGATPMEMEREVANLRAALATLDRDNDEMRVELDRKDEKLSRVLQDSSQYMDEISQLKLRLKNADLQISHTGESAKEQIREVEFLKKQLENNRRDLEKIIRERDEALKELHKISGAHAKGQMERRSVESELEFKSKEADDLRKQVQRYIDEVRRIEELLLDKEEEMEMLIQHYRALTVENGNLEEQRTNLEKEAHSIRDSVKDAVDQNISFKTQLASQNALVQSLEEEIQRFTQQISHLQNQLGSKTEKEEMLAQESKASKDLLYRLEVQMDKLKLDLADSDSKRKQLEVENAELAAHIASLETRLHDETDRQQQLETLVANSRDNDFQNERTALNISRERDDLAEKLTSLQQRSETLNGEVSRYRLKSIELQSELDRTRRQLDGEKRDRESAISELKRAREQLHSSSANYLLKSALGSSGLQSEGSLQQSPGSGSALRQNLLGSGEGLQRSSREQSPFMTPHVASDLQMDTPPNATSTSRYQEKPEYSASSNAPGTRSSNNPPDTTQDNDGFENWDSPN